MTTSPSTGVGHPAPTGFRKILKNSIILIGARITSKFAMTAFMVILARTLGAEAFGVYSSVLAFIAFFALVEEFGLTPPMIRRIAKSPDQGGKILGAVLGLKVILGVLAYLLLMVTSISLNVSPQITAILGISMIFEFLSLTITRAFEAYEKMNYVAIITIVERVVLSVTGIGAVLLAGSLVALSYAYLFTFICSLAIAVHLFRTRVSPFRVHVPRESWKMLVREAGPFVASGFLSIFWTRADIYFLTSFRSPGEVGWYTAALRIVEAQIFIPVAILGSVFPVLSRLHGSSSHDFTRILGKNFIFLMIVGGCVAAGTYIFAEDIVAILFGSSYADSARVLKIFSPMIFFSFLNYLLGGALIAMGKEIFPTVILGLGALVCVVSGFYFIPVEGTSAAAYIKLAAETLSFALQGVFLGWMLVKFRKTAARPGVEGEKIAYETVTSRASDG